MEAIETTEIGL